MKKGHVFKAIRRKNGTGTILKDGRKLIFVNGEQLLSARVIAEQVTGVELTLEMVVHHINGDPSDDRPENLLICPNASYHRIIHQREKALDACGDANKSRCRFCGKWDNIENMYHNKVAFSQYHRSCRQKYRHEQPIYK